MNRIITISIGFIFAILAFSNFSIDKEAEKSFVMTTVNEEPVLPEVPYVYTVDQIPDYLADPDPTPVPYYVSQVVTNDITSVEDDIATLGRVLFYDKKLSSLENISCGSCHDQSLSFAENKAVSEGLVAPTKRNAMQLNDLGWSNSRRFSWDMEHTSLRDMLTLPLTDTNEIGANMWEIALKLENTSYYPALFEKAYGEAYVTNERILEALEQFIQSMNTFDTKFDQNVPTNFQDFTESEMRGMATFQTSCTSCHTQGNTSTFSAAPYMHDGRFNTLEEVIEHYSSGIEPNEHTAFQLPDGGYDFNDQEKEDLLAFMKTLTDHSFGTNPKWSNPFTGGTNTNDVLQFEDLVLKPNPMADRAVIEFKNDKNELVSINILSSDGRLIKHDNTTGSQYMLEKSTFDSGLYYVELIKGNAKSVQKLMVK